MGSLSNLYISQSYQSLIHLGTNNTASANLIVLEDGLGNSIGVAVNTSGSLYLSGSLTASLQQGYLYVGGADGKTFAVPTSSIVTNINTGSLVTTASFNAYTQSNDQKVNALIAATASYVTDSETGSFARYDISNPWSADQTFTNISAVSASFAYVQTIFETASVIYSSGSNQFGDELTDVQTLSGSVKVQGSLTVNGTPVLTSSVDISGLVTTASFNAYTQSNDQRVSSLEANSASVNISITELNSFTTSADSRLDNLEAATSSYAISSSVAAVDAAQQAQIDALIAFTGSVTASINTGSFATTGSNTFIGEQIISGNVDVRDNIFAGYIDMRDDGGLFFRASGSNVVPGVGEFWSVASQFQVGDLVFVQQPSNDKVMSFGLNDRYVKFWKGLRLEPGFDGWDVFQTPLVISSSFGGQTEILDVKGNVSASNLNLSGALTASLTEGYVWVGGAGNRTALVATSSFGGSIPAGQFATLGANIFTGSQVISEASLTINSTGSLFFSLNGATQNNILFNSPSNQFTSYGNFLFNNNGQLGGSGSISFLAASASIGFFARDGVTIGRATPAGGSIPAGGVKMNTISGSLVLAPNNFSSLGNDLLHISSSNLSNNVNLVFKNNNTAADTIISGSGNIFSNTQAVTAGFKRYMTGGNIAVGGSGAAVPQVTGSLTFSPTIANNFFGVSATPLLYRGPVSSSTVNMNNNVLAGGQVLFGPNTGSNFERAVSGLTFNNNVVNGSINATAAKTPLSASFSIQNCNMGGSTTLNADSSSIQFNGTIQQGGLTINNSYHPTTYTAASAVLSFAANAYIGLGNSIFASGSNATFTTPARTIIASGMLGANNTFSASLNGDNAQIHSTYLLGQSLVALGTNTRATTPTAGDWGSVFVGRWNAIDGTKNQTAETIFAVGTGTSGSAGITRKTGFLIDSGSNTFIEGTLNVSGSTRITGSLILSSSAVNELTVIGGTVLSGSAFINNLQNGVTDVLVTYDNTTGELRKATAAAVISASFDSAEFWSTITESGSAGVSGSITFNNSGSVAGISLVNDTQITVSQAGTYNIQFSAQLNTDAGADTIWAWFKKNGNNISDSASKAVLANNTAQIMTVNILDEAQANDYYELAYQTLNGNAIVLYEPASGNIPAIPSVILTITQIR